MPTGRAGRQLHGAGDLTGGQFPQAQRLEDAETRGHWRPPHPPVVPRPCSDSVRVPRPPCLPQEWDAESACARPNLQHVILECHLSSWPNSRSTMWQTCWAIELAARPIHADFAEPTDGVHPNSVTNCTCPACRLGPKSTRRPSRAITGTRERGKGRPRAPSGLSGCHLSWLPWPPPKQSRARRLRSAAR
jgi:hypothetical protein